MGKEPYGQEEDFFRSDEEKNEENGNGDRAQADEGRNPYLLPQGQKAAGEPNEPCARKKRSKVWRYVAAVGLAVLCFIGGGLATWLSLDPQMRSLIRLKTRMDMSYYEDVDDEKFYNAVFGAINTSVLDSYSQYMTADEYAADASEGAGNRSGVGLMFYTQAADGSEQMFVTRVCGNSPAEEAGLKEGDYVVGFGKTQETVQDSKSFEALSAFLATVETGETFYLKVQRGEATQLVAVYKDDYVENYVFYRTATTAYRFTGDNASVLSEGGEPLAALPADTAYIRLLQFNGGAAEQFEKAMQLFKKEGKKNLVLDLRDNGGGYLDIMQEIASYFCKSSSAKRPVVAVAKYGNGRKDSFTAEGNVYGTYFSEDSRICVLADSGTASASECLIGCMVDYGTIGYEDICLSTRAGVAKTYGKGIMQTTYPLALVEKDAVRLTTAKIYWPQSGTCIHDRGILPEDGAKTVAENYETDGELNAAIAALFA